MPETTNGTGYQAEGVKVEVRAAKSRAKTGKPPPNWRADPPPVRPKGAKPQEPVRVPLSANELFRMEFPPIKYVVPGYIVEGATLLIGPPKLGKSWLCMEMALAVASGGECLGVTCAQGDVLYLALEDNLRRLQSRMVKLWTSIRHDPPKQLHFETEWPRAGDGISALRKWLKDHPKARLVIIDVLAMFRAVEPSKNQTLYQSDYNTIKEIQALASEAGVAIVIVHHTRKGGSGAGHASEKVSGTQGLTGATDSNLVLDRDQNGVTINVTGRDVEEKETAVQFDRITCRWKVLGDAVEVRRTDERSVILKLLEENRAPMSPAELADAQGLSRNNVKQLLFKMAKAGEVVKTGRGLYAHPDNAGYSAENANPDNLDNQDNLDL